jgi:hypothetical protein
MEDKAELPSETSATATETEAAAVVATPPNNTPSENTIEKEAIAHEVIDNFPQDQKVEFTSAMLKPLCTNKYGCLKATIYPLGWSADGKFAYLIEEANEAVVNLTLHFIIQDMETDKQLIKNTFKASEQAGYREEKGLYTVKSVWAMQEEQYNRWITDHQISAGNGTVFYPLTEAKADWPYRFSSSNKMMHSDMFDLDFVSEHQLQATQQGVGKKTIFQHTFSKYDLALATQAIGYFHSPFEERIAVVDAFERRGYEGPPNVLKMMVVGCTLGEGF